MISYYKNLESKSPVEKQEDMCNVKMKSDVCNRLQSQSISVLCKDLRSFRSI